MGQCFFLVHPQFSHACDTRTAWIANYFTFSDEKTLPSFTLPYENSKTNIMSAYLPGLPCMKLC